MLDDLDILIFMPIHKSWNSGNCSLEIEIIFISALYNKDGTEIIKDDIL